MDKYKLKFDEYSCWGCKSCEVACKLENKTPNGMKYLEIVEDGPKTIDGKLDFVYRARVCRHCDDPPCIDVCPTEAITKRDDGIVVLNSDECSGCGSCISACPYQAISFDDTEGVARKCNLCSHRVDHGLYPACADNICLGHCIYFGPADTIDEMVQDKSWLKERLNQAQADRARQMKHK